MKSMKKVVTIKFTLLFITVINLIGSVLYSYNLTKRTTTIVNDGSEFIELSINSKASHYAWALDLQESIFLKTEFTKELDPTKCSLGQNIYADYENEDIKNFMTIIEPIHKEIHESAHKVLDLIEVNQEQALFIYETEILSNIEKLVNHLDNVIEDTQEAVSTYQDALQTVLLYSSIITITLTGFVILILVRTYFYVRNKIANPVLDIIDGCDELSKGNLNFNFQNDCDNEIGLLGDALQSSVDEMNYYINDISYLMEKMSNKSFNITIDKEYIGDFRNIQISIESFISTMKYVLEELNESSIDVSDGVNQIYKVSKNISQGTTEQSGSIQELNSTLVEFSKSISDTVQNINDMNRFVSSTGEEVSDGNDKMNRVTEAIGIISVKSNEISKIIKTIDEIAQQTNILAINAAVEAARAGNSGKGFAVVAEEVRNLAQKSTKAASETAKLIEDSIDAVQDGVLIVNETAYSLSNIVNLSAEIEKRINDVFDVSNIQLNKIEEITQNIQQISSVVQLNASTSEESALASEELDNQSQKLNKLVSEFKYL